MNLLTKGEKLPGVFSEVVASHRKPCDGCGAIIFEGQRWDVKLTYWGSDLELGGNRSISLWIGGLKSPRIFTNPWVVIIGREENNKPSPQTWTILNLKLRECCTVQRCTCFTFPMAFVWLQFWEWGSPSRNTSKLLNCHEHLADLLGHISYTCGYRVILGHGYIFHGHSPRMVLQQSCKLTPTNDKNYNLRTSTVSYELLYVFTDMYDANYLWFFFGLLST